MNEPDSRDILAALCQRKTEQLGTTVANGTVHVQQCAKRNHGKDTI